MSLEAHGITIDTAAKSFFDAALVEAEADNWGVRFCSRFGAFTRRKAKGLIRRKRKPSKPGQPPASHVGLLRDHIYFAKHPDERIGVIVGPALTRGAAKNRPTNGTVPQVLEEGGTVEVIRDKKPRTATIQPRPYMAPAFADTVEKMGTIGAQLAR